MNLILASTSPYRKQLLEKIGISFDCVKPDLDEEQLKESLLKQNHSPVQIAESLSKAKCKAAFKQINNNTSVIIAGDQLVAFDNTILGKPNTSQKAIAQLQQLNGQKHQLITAVSLFINGKVIHKNHITHLHMKNLSENEIKNYVLKDNPLDCAGSYKIEQHGITLFQAIDCDDFTAIQGLPMIWLSNCLKENGYEFFKN
ncbi:Maf family protein [bacterium]|nr:Maf family protein [bacterium]